MAIGLYAILRPLGVLWFGLKVLDDVSLITRIVRLGAVIIPGNDENELCSLCDDVMGDLLVQGGIDALPCGLVCLRIPSCVKMCEKVKDASKTSTMYPCVAAGYCDATEEQFMDSDDDCSVGALFSCQPRKYCHRVRENLSWSCKLRPGIGRWVGLKNSVSDHAGALAAGLISQPHCSEPGAGPYCIAKPKGFGALCELLGSTLSILYGGYRSIVAIESPGGDDDTQWLTFWLILGVVLSIERFFARPILSTVPLYFEAKFVVYIWLLWFNGAERTYRKFRRILINYNIVKPAQAANNELTILEETGKAMIRKRLVEIKREIMKEKRQSILNMKSMRLSDWNKFDVDDWEPDFGDDDDSIDAASNVDAAEKVDKLCDFLLSNEGTDELMKSKDISSGERARLLELASYHVQFHPKFLYIRLMGTVSGPEGELPPMDANGLADPYVTCRLVPCANFRNHSKAEPKQDEQEKASFARFAAWNLNSNKKVAISRCKYHTRRPQWNELLELPLTTGYIDDNGMYRNDAVQSTSLALEVWDADIEFWGTVLLFSPLILFCLLFSALVGYVTGISDHMTVNQVTMVQISYLVVGFVLVLSYIMAVVRKADDDPIGQCILPLKILMDKGEHSLRLTLREIKQKGEKNKKTEPPTNSVGGFGVIRAKLMLSES